MLQGTSTVPLVKKDVPAIVKAVKTNSKNSVLCREGICALHSKLFDKEGGRAAQKTFTGGKTGGLSAVLLTLEDLIEDPGYLELAVSLLWTLMSVAGRGKGRIVTKLAKKGGSRILFSIVAAHPKQPKLLAGALSLLGPLIATDRKVANLCRATNALGALLAILKPPTVQRDVLTNALSVLNALSRMDQNVVLLGKKGAIPLLVDLCQRLSTKPIPFGFKHVLKTILNLCKNERHVADFVREGAVLALLNALKDLREIDTQKLVVDALKCLAADTDGRLQFTAMGGSPAVAILLEANNADKGDDQLLDVVLHLQRFNELTDLPIVSDEEVTWSVSEALEQRQAPEQQRLACEGSEHPLLADIAPRTDDEEQAAAVAALARFSVELDPSLLARVRPPRPSPPTQHVRPFIAPRPAPSCSSSLQYVPDCLEPFHQPSSTARRDLIRRFLQRLAHPEDVLHDVVFDDIPRARGPVPSPCGPFAPFGFLRRATGCLTPTLRFSSHFESGNLKRAIRVHDTEYDLILNTDINCQVHCQWFYFSVENAVPGVTYRFNLINMEKGQSQFGDGQRPLLFSEREFTARGLGWLRSGADIAYIRNAYTRRLRRGGMGDSPNYFTLHFAIEVPHAGDRVYLAYCYPYTYSDLQTYLRTLPDMFPGCGQYLVPQELCRTLGDNVCNLLTVTTLGEGSPIPIPDRKVIVCSGRVHPGESAASWMIKGLLDFLLDGNNPTAKYLRDSFVWKIVPMLNPDGVVNGNHRCSLAGHDLNREWVAPDRRLYPEIWTLKHYLRHLKQVEGRTVLIYTDFHGHSKRRNVFMYGCSPKFRRPELLPSILSALSVIERLLPRLLSEIAPFFAFDHCGFKIQKGHGSTGRVVVWRQLGVRLSYTLEASLCGGDRIRYRPVPNAESIADYGRDDPGQQQAGHFNTGHYATMGMLFAKAVQLFCNMDLEEGRKMMDVMKNWANTNPSETVETKEQSSNDETGDASDAAIGSSDEGHPHRSSSRSTRKASRSLSNGGRPEAPVVRTARPLKARSPLTAIPVTVGNVPQPARPLPLKSRSASAGPPPRYAIPPPPAVPMPQWTRQPPSPAGPGSGSLRHLVEALNQSRLADEDDADAAPRHGKRGTTPSKKGSTLVGLEDDDDADSDDEADEDDDGPDAD